LAEKAEIPAGVLNVVTSSRQNASAAGKVICEHPLVAKISFTGSTAVGKVVTVTLLKSHVDLGLDDNLSHLCSLSGI